MLRLCPTPLGLVFGYVDVRPRCDSSTRCLTCTQVPNTLSSDVQLETKLKPKMKIMKIVPTSQAHQYLKAYRLTDMPLAMQVMLVMNQNLQQRTPSFTKPKSPFCKSLMTHGQEERQQILRARTLIMGEDALTCLQCHP